MESDTRLDWLFAVARPSRGPSGRSVDFFVMKKTKSGFRRDAGDSMKVAKLEAILVRVPYKRAEESSLIARGGIADVLIKVTADKGLVGWGECTRAADVPGIESAVKAMTPVVLGRDPWDKEAIHRDLAVPALWAFQPMTGNFAYAGIDMALWDLCGRQPASRSTGCRWRTGRSRLFLLHGGTPAEIERQKDGMHRGYRAYYIKAGVDERREEAMSACCARVIGPRADPIDVNQAWTPPQAMPSALARAVRLDFVEAPVPIDRSRTTST